MDYLPSGQLLAHGALAALTDVSAARLLVPALANLDMLQKLFEGATRQPQLPATETLIRLLKGTVQDMTISSSTHLVFAGTSVTVLKSDSLTLRIFSPRDASSKRPGIGIILSHGSLP